MGHATNPVYAKAMVDEVQRAGTLARVEIKPVVMVRGNPVTKARLDAARRQRQNVAAERAVFLLGNIDELNASPG